MKTETKHTIAIVLGQSLSQNELFSYFVKRVHTEKKIFQKNIFRASCFLTAKNRRDDSAKSAMQKPDKDYFKI